MIQFRVVRWLGGLGHPELSDASITDEALDEAQKQDPLLRANLLAVALSDCELLPADPTEQYTVSIQSFP